MKRTMALLQLSALVGLQAGCGGSDPTVSVPDLPAGVYTVSVGSADAPVTGKYYAGADGSRLVVLSNGVDRVDTLYRRSGSDGAWVAVPAPDADVTVTLLRSDREATPPIALAGMAGSYIAELGSGVTARFTLAADGTLSAGDTACKLSGRLSESALPNTLKLSLTAANCGSAIPVSSVGVIAVDPDELPARFRMVSDDGQSIAHLRGYAE